MQGGSPRTSLGTEEDPRGAALAAPVAAGRGVSFCPPPRPLALRTPRSLLSRRLLIFTKTGTRTFFAPWKCAALCNSILSVPSAGPAAIATFRESSTRLELIRAGVSVVVVFSNVPEKPQMSIQRRKIQL